MVFVQSNAPFTWFLIGTVQVQSDFDTVLDCVNKSVKRKASQAGSRCNGLAFVRSNSVAAQRGGLWLRATFCCSCRVTRQFISFCFPLFSFLISSESLPAAASTAAARCVVLARIHKPAITGQHCSIYFEENRNVWWLTIRADKTKAKAVIPFFDILRSCKW